MASNKTKPTSASVTEFLNKIEDPKKKSDCFKLIEMMHQITNQQPKMWGNSIVGFGQYHYKYKSGRQGEWFLTGFSPRKQNLSLYLMCDLKNKTLPFHRLGKHKKSVGCLYIKQLEDVNTQVLEEIISKAVEYTKSLYP
ncbi:MAG: DUF1801 domain-containing protein [Flavobacteriaceae bacterium]|nr:DUF1801 domain-containing protein [Flavobacteriaceae bacterium]